MKGDHNTVADAISCLDYNPILNPDRNINYSLQQASDKTGIKIDSLKWEAVQTSFAHLIIKQMGLSFKVSVSVCPR